MTQSNPALDQASQVKGIVLCKSALTSNQPATDLKVPFTPSGFKNSLEWLLELKKVLHFHYSFIVTDTKDLGGSQMQSFPRHLCGMS